MWESRRIRYFSPDGSTIAFTGSYDGNTDVFTIPATGGVPFRVTYHPAADFAVAWTPDGKNIVFRSTRISQSRYTQLYEVPAKGGIAKPLPLPMAYQGQFSPDGKEIAYSPLPPAYGFDYTAYRVVGKLSRRAREHDLDHHSAGTGVGADSA